MFTRIFAFRVIVALAVILALLPQRARADGGCWLVTSSGTMVADATYKCVIIFSGVTLDTGYHSLTVTGESGLVCLGNLIVTGNVLVSGGGTTTVIGSIYINQNANLRFTKSTTLKGIGTLAGAFVTSQINIGAPGIDATLTSGILIHGSLTILNEGIPNQGDFHNDGRVIADSGTALVLDATLTGISDCGYDSCGSGAHWQSIGGGSTLRIDANPGSTLGYFYVPSGNTLYMGWGVTVNATGINSSHGYINGPGAFSASPC